MATNLDIPPELMARACELGGHRTKKAAVTQALKDYVRRLEQAEIHELFGAVEYEETYDYKKERARR